MADEMKIKKLEEMNNHVVALVTDMGGSNRKLWKLLGATTEKP